MRKSDGAHESYYREEELVGSSDRSLGIVFCVVFSLIGLWPVLDGNPPRWWSFGIAAAFLGAGLWIPRVLSPLNRVWLRFGLLLHRIVNPMIMGLLFYVCVTPMGLVLRLLGKDPLRKRFDPKVDSYWIERKPPGPKPETMKNQY